MRGGGGGGSNGSTTTSTRVINKSDEVPRKKSSLNEPQEKKSEFYEISIDLKYSSYKKNIVFFGKDYGRTQWRSIYEVIYDLFILLHR